MSQLEAIKDKKPGWHNKCRVGKFLETLDAKERKRYEAVIDDTNIVMGDIAKVFADNNIHLSAFMIRYHRNRLRKVGCQCPINQN